MFSEGIKYLIENRNTNKWLEASLEGTLYGGKTVTVPKLNWTNEPNSAISFNKKADALFYMIRERSLYPQDGYFVTEHEFINTITT